jgi:hypothetical protein
MGLGDATREHSGGRLAYGDDRGVHEDGGLRRQWLGHGRGRRHSIRRRGDGDLGKIGDVC